MTEESVVCYVNSLNRLGGHSGDFSYRIDLPPRNRFDSVCMLQASIPKTFYLIANGRNTFVLREGVLSATITIPNGNYSRQQFAFTLQTGLNAMSPNAWLYRIIVPSPKGGDNGKYRYLVTLADGVTPTPSQPSFVLPRTSSPALPMGFPIDTTVTFVAGVLDSTNITLLQATDVIYIIADCVSNNGTGILQDLNTVTPDFSAIIYQVGDSGGVKANRRQLVSNQTNGFRFKLTNVYNETLDLNGLECQFSLLFWDSKARDFGYPQHQSSLFQLDEEK